MKFLAYAGLVLAALFAFFSAVVAHLDRNWMQLGAALLLLSVVVLPQRLAPALTWKMRLALCSGLFFLVILFHKN